MLESISRYFESSGDDQLSSAFDAVSRDILQGGDFSMLDLVQMLHSRLTDASDPVVRAKALGLLARCIEVQQTRLGHKEISALMTFICSRLADQPSVFDALTGVLVLLQCPAIDAASNVELVLSTIFSELSVQSFVQTTRNLVLRVFAVIIDRFADQVVAMEQDFIIGFITSLDGEKDPRNLLLGFRIVQFIVGRLAFGEYAEELFEVCSCYFPITFRPPPDDPYGITAEDLKLELMQSLVASPLFADYAMPLFLEKLSSSVEAAVRDSAECLSRAIPVFGIHSYIAHLSSIWRHIQKHLLSLDTKLVELLLQLLCGILSSMDLFADARSLYLDEIQASCLDEMKELSAKNAKPYTLVLTSIARSCESAWSRVCGVLIPLLLDKYACSNSLAVKKVILDSVGDLLESSAAIIATGKISDKSKLFDWCGHLLSMFLTNILSVDVTSAMKEASYRGVLAMVNVPCLLDRSQLSQVVSSLLQVKDFDVTAGLCEIARSDPDLVYELAFQSAVLVTPMMKVLCSVDTLNSIVVDKIVGHIGHDHAIADVEIEQLAAALKHRDSGAGLDRLLDFMHNSIVQDSRLLLPFAELVRVLPVKSQERFIDLDMSPEFVHAFVCHVSQPVVDRFSNELVAFINRCDGMNEKILGDCICAIVNKASSPIVEFHEHKLASSVIKGYLVKNDKRAFELLDKVLDQLQSNNATMSAEMFATFCGEDPVMTKRNHYLVKPLYKQRMFVHCLPKLNVLYRQAEVDKVAILIALSHVIRIAPKMALVSELPSMVPLLFHALEAGTDSLKLSALESFKLVLADTPATVKSDIGTLINILLKLAAGGAGNNGTATRIAAIQCLAMVANQPFEILFPHKKQVIAMLKQCIDDRKRLVRVVAVECRNKWFI
eukprot:Partr_v1_DN28850_c0_g1_i5_m33529 putative MMS19 nucleotide excision repair homolog (S. cerevisiae)